MADKPHPYDSNERVVFRTDHLGNDIAIRPHRFLANAVVGTAEINRVVNMIRAEIQRRAYDDEEDRLITREDQVLGDWFLFDLAPELDVVRVVRGLRERGVPAQPNHVYFVNSLPKSFSPNLFAPNLFAPNLFAPNLFAPNLFAPNLFAPNLFAPNLFAPNLFAGLPGGGCCCPRGLSEGEPRDVPHLAAQPVDAPTTQFPDAVAEQKVQIHVVDIASPGPDRDPKYETGELTVPGFIKANAIDENEDGWADPATGHGDFVKSIFDLHSGMGAQLWHAADPLGDIDDANLVKALIAVEEEAGKDETQAGAGQKVLNLSLSGYNEDDRPSIVLGDQIGAMVDDGWLIVASAGNNASCRLAWPAALPGVIAVGAVDDCGPAWFSNYGPWVDASAAGIDVVARYPDLSELPTYDVVVNDDDTKTVTTEFSTGWAKWSGTSFSAPFVAAKLAVELQAGSTREQAIETVITDPELPRLPYFGTVVT